jgi:hypothetical protein
MKTTQWVGMGLALAALSGPSRADEGHSGNAKAHSYLIYPSGADLKQAYSKPSAEAEGGLQSFAAAPGAVSSSASASVVAAHPGLADNDMMPLLNDVSRVSLNGGDQANLVGAPPRALWRHSYRLQHKGVPLSKFSSISHVVEATGTDSRTVYIRTINVPGRDSLPPTTATVRSQDAEALGRRDAMAAVPHITARVSRPHREILVRGEGQPELVWSFIVQVQDPAHIFARQYWVAARDAARIVHKEDLVYLEAQDYPAAETATATGKVTGNIWGLGKSPFDLPSSNQPLQDYLGATSGATKFITNADGIYNATGTINLKLMGPFAVVENKAGALLAPTKTGNNLFLNAHTEAELAQVSAFYWVNFAHEFARPFLPATPTLLVNNPVRVNVNQTCNAFWSTGDHSLNFFKSGGGCANSAYCDVACHEFGHGIDAEFGGIKDGGLSEGFGDSVAILITHSNIIGKDFLGKGTKLRDATEIHTWPPPNPEVHEVGKIYNGFTWQLTRELLKTSTEATAFAVAKDLIMGAAALNPKDIPDAVRLSFFVDAKTGSKHFKALAAAADSRKIPRPAHPVAEADALALLTEN